MNEKILAAFWCISAVTPWTVRAGDLDFKAGGIMLTLPTPPGDFVEVGDKFKVVLFDLLAPSTNRLVSAYLPPAALAGLEKTGSAPGFETYAMVETLRRAEFMDLTPQDFSDYNKAVQSSFGQVDSLASNLQDEVNVRLKALGTKQVDVGRPEVLGSLFKKTDATGFAMLNAVKTGDKTVTMAVGMGTLRVRQRLVLVYLWHRYESPETVEWVRKNLEAWADHILAANATTAK